MRVIENRTPQMAVEFANGAGGGEKSEKKPPTGYVGVDAFDGGDLESAEEDSQTSPVEEVAKTVPVTDDEDLPVWTFRMWVLGILSCSFLAFINQFFFFRKAPIVISALAAQIAVLPIGRFMHWALPKKVFTIGGWRFTLNDGPFNIKEHVLITIFANAGTAFGIGSPYSMGTITLLKKFYFRNINFLPAVLLVITTQVCGYGWAGLLRRFLVDPSQMWWPSTLINVSLFHTLHKEDTSPGMSRFKFFLLCAIGMFVYNLFPGYLFTTLTSLSAMCWIWKNSVTAHQIGSGDNGLGVFNLSLDWGTTTAYLGSPNAAPWFVIVNIFVGFVAVVWIATPALYWKDVYDAKTFPIISSSLFLANGQRYKTKAVVGDDLLTLDLAKYEEYGQAHLSMFFAFTYGVGFAALAATVAHVALFNGPGIWRRLRASVNEKADVHVRLLQKYPPLPEWWFTVLLVGSVALAIVTVETWKDLFQIPWWGVLLGTSFAATMTLPIGIIAATTNQIPGLNIISAIIWGYLKPGQAIGNVVFKTFGYISMAQALMFLSDFKLGLYMKIPPRSMFLVQVLGTILAAVVSCSTTFWLLDTVEGICDTNETWSCPIARVMYSSSIIWGLIGPERFFGSNGIYRAQNWWWLAGGLAPLPVYIAHRVLGHKYKWIQLINMPILIGATGVLPPASTSNYVTWFILGWFFQYYLYRYRSAWWTKYNYVLSAAFDTGVAFMSIAIFFAFTNNDINVSWWGNDNHCNLATCPRAFNITATDVNGNDCPFKL